MGNFPNLFVNLLGNSFNIMKKIPFWLKLILVCCFWIGVYFIFNQLFNIIPGTSSRWEMYPNHTEIYGQ